MNRERFIGAPTYSVTFLASFPVCGGWLRSCISRSHDRCKERFTVGLPKNGTNSAVLILARTMRAKCVSTSRAGSRCDSRKCARSSSIGAVKLERIGLRSSRWSGPGSERPEPQTVVGRRLRRVAVTHIADVAAGIPAKVSVQRLRREPTPLYLLHDATK